MSSVKGHLIVRLSEFIFLYALEVMSYAEIDDIDSDLDIATLKDFLIKVFNSTKKKS